MKHFDTELYITPASHAELDHVWEILVGAAQWLRSRRINQWGHYLDGSGRQELEAAVEAGEVYLARMDGRPVATISLQLAASEWDRALWGEDGGTAAYVHRLAIDRLAAGSGVGDRLLDWAEHQARAAGKRRLRLDCVGHNERLNAYYARRYTYMGQSPNIGMLFSKYEKDL